MFELPNEQRKYFSLSYIEPAWEKVIVKPSPYDDFVTIAYLDGTSIRKVITINEDENQDKARYGEFQVEAELSADKQMILPKTAKGKAKLFSSSNLLKLTPIGMALSFARRNVAVINFSTEKDYYKNAYTGEKINGFSEFVQWIQKWCDNTTGKQQSELEHFASEKREHNRYTEGDFFRFRLSRDQYGYGRILLNFDKMRKEKIPFWDVFIGKPLCVGVYHIATECTEVSIEELKALPMLPSGLVMDNIFFYGECTIIGNEPVIYENQDYPIHYGNSISMKESGLRYQCGRTYIELPDKEALYDGFRNGSIGWNLNVTLPILMKCIEEKSNRPYWDMYYPSIVDGDLRNPKYADKLVEIKKQLGV